MPFASPPLRHADAATAAAERRRRRIVRIGAPLAAIVLAGCTIRTDGSDVYLGPVLLRATDPCHGGATTTVQAVRLGIVGDVGRQTGVAIGVAERVAVAAVDEDGAPPRCDEWEVVGGIPGGVAPDRWTLSPLYARRRSAASPEFVSRRVLGAEAAAGPELAAVSVGVVSRTEVRPDGDAFYSLTFDSTRPMATTFRKWPYRPGTEFPLSPTDEEDR